MEGSLNKHLLIIFYVLSTIIAAMMQRWIKAQCLEKAKASHCRLCDHSYSRWVRGAGSSYPEVWRLQKGGSTIWDLRMVKKTQAGCHLKQGGAVWAKSSRKETCKCLPWLWRFASTLTDCRRRLWEERACGIGFSWSDHAEPFIAR